MALNVPPAMTQAPTQGQQGQGNSAVSVRSWFTDLVLCVAGDF